MRPGPSVLLVIGIAGAWAAPAVADCRGSDYRDFYRQGVQARDFRRWTEVVECMEAAIRARGRESRERVEISGAREERYLPYYHLGFALAELGSAEEARDALRRSVEQGASRGDSRWADLQQRLQQVETQIAELRIEEVEALRRQVLAELEAMDGAPEAVEVYDRAVTSLGAARALVGRREPVLAQEMVEEAASGLQQTSKRLRQVVRAPPEETQAISPRLVQAAGAYAELDYARVLEVLDGQTFSTPQDRLNAHLLLAASIHGLIRRGRAQGRSLADVRSHVRECLAIRPAFRPPESEFSPEFVALFDRP